MTTVAFIPGDIWQNTTVAPTYSGVFLILKEYTRISDRCRLVDVLCADGRIQRGCMSGVPRDMTYAFRKLT
jgi:hypothetical protein